MPATRFVDILGPWISPKFGRAGLAKSARTGAERGRPLPAPQMSAEQALKSTKIRNLTVALLLFAMHCQGASAAPAAADIVKTYEAVGAAVFSDAQATAESLDKTVDGLLAKPSVETLKAARDAWKAARVPYLQSEGFRFGNKIVDDSDPLARFQQLFRGPAAVAGRIDLRRNVFQGPGKSREHTQPGRIDRRSGILKGFNQFRFALSRQRIGLDGNAEDF